MQLFGAPPTRATRPLWFVNLLDLDCEIVPLNPGDPGDREQLAKLNPSCKLPILVDGDIVLTESVAISLYLAERYGDGRYIPSDLIDRATMDQWLYFLVTEIEQPLWRMALHTAIYAEEERSTVEPGLAARDCRRELARLEAHLEGRETLVDGGLSVADFIAANTLDWADLQGFLDQSPNCKGFVDRLYAHPAAPPRIAEAFAYLHTGNVAPKFRSALDPKILTAAQ